VVGVNDELPGARAPAVRTPADIAALPEEQRGELISRALEESKGWLAVATTGTDPTPLAEFRAWAATVAEMTRQRGLAEEIQLDAREMVLRAERGIGLTIRQGQDAGEIATLREAKSYAGKASAAKRGDQLLQEKLMAERKPMPSDFVDPGLLNGRNNHSPGVFDLTDGIDDDVFEEALDQARVDRNLSRAHVTRKAQGVADERERLPMSERVDQIRRLAESRASSRQIAHEIGVGPEWVRELARRNNIEIPADRSMSRAQYNLDPANVLGSMITDIHTATEVADSLVSLDSLPYLDDQVMREWKTKLDGAMTYLRKLRRELGRAIDEGVSNQQHQHEQKDSA
jgi:hypothetical protein